MFLGIEGVFNKVGLSETLQLTSVFQDGQYVCFQTDAFKLNQMGLF